MDGMRKLLSKDIYTWRS